MEVLAIKGIMVESLGTFMRLKAGANGPSEAAGDMNDDDDGYQEPAVGARPLRRFRNN
jgi:hypothetical protein